MNSAVIVIDVQRGLCEGQYAAFEADKVIQRINTVVKNARDASVPVIFIQHDSPDGLLKAESEGWQLANGLSYLDGDDYFVRKQATDSFHQTDLSPLLVRLGIEQLVICGLQSEFCVDTTTRRALALGYPVVLVSDGHSTMDNTVLSARQISDHHTVTLANIESFGPRVLPVTADAIRF